MACLRATVTTFIKLEARVLFGESGKCQKVEWVRKASCFLLRRLDKNLAFMLMSKSFIRLKMEGLWWSLFQVLKMS